MMRGIGGRAKLEPSQSLNGIRLTLPRMPFKQPHEAARVLDASR